MFRRGASFFVIASCLICTVAGPFCAQEPAAADTKAADDSASELKLVPGWSCSQPSGIAGATSKSDATSKADATSKDPKPKTLDLSGAENNYFYGSYGQLGPRGFFGDADTDRSSTGLFSNLNGWVGNPRLQISSIPGITGTPAQSDIATDLVSGTGASVSNAVLNITPHYGNDWVNLKARYTINAYSTSAAPGAATPIALPQLTLWSAKISTPLADISLGKSIFQRGCSLQFSLNRSAEYLMLERSYCVPNILGCLVSAGVLPPRVMSWFNPELWPRYSQAHQNDKAKDLGEPEYQFYGGDSKTKKSIFTLMDERRQQEKLKELQEKLKEVEKKKPEVQDYLKKVEDYLTEEEKNLGVQKKNLKEEENKLKEVQDNLKKVEAVLKEMNLKEEENKLKEVEDYLEEKEREKDPPSATDSYAWNYLTPGCLHIGFGFIGWEVPTVFPTNGAALAATTPTPFAVKPLATPFNTNLFNQNDFAVNAMSNLIGAVSYTSSDLEFGVGFLRSSYHQGPEVQQTFQTTSPAVLPAVPLSISTPTFERYVTEGWAYLTYNNGRFFFRTELDWFNRVYRFQRSQDGTFFGQADTTDGSGSRFASRYWESWRYMAEAGANFGTLAGKVFYSFMGGPDRRHGVYIDRQPFIQDFPQQALGIFDPYSTLLSFRFGSGVNAPGHISDASVFAVKLDYLLASNLMIEGSFLKAIRNSNGYALGFIRPDTTATKNFGQVLYAEPPGSTFANPAPSVPDKDLGWEVMAGIIWELMDGWAFKGQIAYWQPGKWFNYACIDKAVLNWDIPSSANNWGVSPDRKIDPVLGWEIYLGATY